VNGATIHGYVRPRIIRGHVYAPVDPYLAAVATSIRYEGGVMLIFRGDRFAQVPVSRREPGQLQDTFVPLARIVRSLGARVSYDSKRHTLDVEVANTEPVATATPFNAAVPRATPAALFTPFRTPTPRPIFTGKPMPRRTPVPAPARTPLRR